MEGDPRGADAGVDVVFRTHDDCGRPRAIVHLVRLASGKILNVFCRPRSQGDSGPR